MSPQTIKFLAFIMFCLITAVSTSCVNAQNASYKPEKINFTGTLLNEKIEYYRRLYPEIKFLILQGGDELLTDIMALYLVLGNQPTSLDYEHPPRQREDLMYVSIERIQMLLQSYTPSAALFKTTPPPEEEENVCVLTINPLEIAADSIRATRHLLNLPQELIQKIPQNLQLPANDYLAFVIDHEVYHCLKSMYVGPQLMSYKKSWAGYNHLHNELGADAYALAMHIKTRGEASLFKENILTIRGMALYNGDPNHLTCKALEQTLKVPTQKIIEMSANQVFDLANTIREHLTISYDEYLHYLAAAVQAIKDIGEGERISAELHNEIRGIKVDSTQVKELVENSRRCINKLIAQDNLE